MPAHIQIEPNTYVPLCVHLFIFILACMSLSVRHPSPISSTPTFPFYIDTWYQNQTQLLILKTDCSSGCPDMLFYFPWNILPDSCHRYT